MIAFIPGLSLYSFMSTAGGSDSRSPHAQPTAHAKHHQFPDDPRLAVSAYTPKSPGIWGCSRSTMVKTRSKNHMRLPRQCKEVHFQISSAHLSQFQECDHEMPFSVPPRLSDTEAKTGPCVKSLSQPERRKTKQCRWCREALHTRTSVEETLLFHGDVNRARRGVLRH
jgi:hypothetical protein